MLWGATRDLDLFSLSHMTALLTHQLLTVYSLLLRLLFHWYDTLIVLPLIVLLWFLFAVIVLTFSWLHLTLALSHTYRFYFTSLPRCRPYTLTLLFLQLSFVLCSLLFWYVFKPSTYHLVSHLDLFVVGTRYVLSLVLVTNINFVVGTSLPLSLLWTLLPCLCSCYCFISV